MRLTKMSRQEVFLDRISKQALSLLQEEEDPKQAMAWAENRLREGNLFPLFLNPSDNPSAWVQQVISDNPDILGESVPWMMERYRQPDGAETFEELILNLIPTEGGL
jgi:hypothetical protein